MFPFIRITQDIKIPLYGLMFLIGFFLAVFIGRRIAPRFQGTKEDTTYAAAYAAIGILVGSKFVYFLTKLPIIIRKFDAFSYLLKESPLTALQYAFGGFVFYGGLLGAVLAVWFYCKQFKVPFLPLLDTFAPLIPLIHGFGRIGCFCSGCCYGKEYHGFGAVHFPPNEIVPELSQVARVPVQLIEAGLNFIVFAILLYLGMKGICKAGQLMGIYLIYYTIARFFLEMLRGDKVRGSVGIFSTSQLISLLLIPIGIYLLSGRVARQKKLTGEDK